MMMNEEARGGGNGTGEEEKKKRKTTTHISVVGTSIEVRLNMGDQKVLRNNQERSSGAKRTDIPLDNEPRPTTVGLPRSYANAQKIAIE